MIDLVFDLGGGILPASYPFALWEALLSHVPDLALEKSVGVLPLRATVSFEGLLISKRTKLVLRLPLKIAPVAFTLSGLDLLPLHTGAMLLGKSRLRQILPFPTLHAQQVSGAADEMLFLEDIQAQLSELGIAGRIICGLRRTLSDTIKGYSLVIHDLKPEDALKLQYAGLGAYRQFGCGIFLPHKVISV